MSEWREYKLGEQINLKRGYDLPTRLRQDGSSGKEKTLLSFPPLRTVRESFPSHGSSLSKTGFPVQLTNFQIAAMNFSVAVGMKYDQIGVYIHSTFRFF